MMFGPNLRLSTEIRTELNSGTLPTIDTVTNIGATPVERELLYHPNEEETPFEEGVRMLSLYK